MPLDDDPGLPIKFGPCSNGEYDPQPLTPVVRETIRRARLESDDNARRLGLSRRNFLLSMCGAATTLLALNACSEEESRAKGKGKPGGTYTLPPESTLDRDAARAALAGNDLVFDVQGHFLEYGSGPINAEGAEFWSGFPQRSCGAADSRACFSIDQFLQKVFVESQTRMIVLSALPIAPVGSPESAALLDEARRIADAVRHDPRVLLHGQALPNVGDLQASLDAMTELKQRYPIAAWKVFTNFPDLYEHNGNAWRLDDGDPALPRVGDAFLRHAVELGVPIVCAHKGFSGGRSAYEYSGYASPTDFGPAAKAHPDVKFVAYHSGYEPDHAEGPFDGATPGGVDRFVASLAASGVGPNQNVYAELGSTWWTVMQKPTEAAHVLGKLLRAVGEDNLLWGTDALFYGAPQDQIDAFRTFEITPQLQEQFGYPALTPEIKRKVLGLNALRLHDVDPITAPCSFTREQVDAARRSLPAANAMYGPRTRAEQRAFVATKRGHPL